MSWIMLEYQCSCGDRVESLERRSDPSSSIDHGCGEMAVRCLSAVRGSVKLGEVTRGRSEPPPPEVLDTRPLADGMPLAEFRARRRKYHADRRYSQIKQELS